MGGLEALPPPSIERSCRLASVVGPAGFEPAKSFGYEPNALTSCAKDPCCGAFHAAVRLSGLSENKMKNNDPVWGGAPDGDRTRTLSLGS